MDKWQKDLKKRTRMYALDIIRLYNALPKAPVAQVLGKQMLRSGTSPGAHYREAIRARSKKEFISKLGGGLQELEETMYWLELLIEDNIVDSIKIKPLLSESDQLIAMFISSINTAKKEIRKGNKNDYENA